MPSAGEGFLCEIVARYMIKLASPSLPRYVLIDFDDSSVSSIGEKISTLCQCKTRTVVISSYRDASQLVKAVSLRGEEEAIIVGVQRSVLGFVASITSVLRILENCLPSMITGHLPGNRERNSSDLADIIFWMSDQGKRETVEALGKYAGNSLDLERVSNILWSMLDRRLLLQYPALLPKFHPIRIVEFVRDLSSDKSMFGPTLKLGMIPSSKLRVEQKKSVAKWYENQQRIFARLGNVRVTSKNTVYRRFLEKMVRSLLVKRKKAYYFEYMRHLSSDKKVARYGVRLDDYDQSGLVGTEIGLADTFRFRISPRQISGGKVTVGKTDKFSIEIMKVLETDNEDFHTSFKESSDQLITEIKSVEGYLIGI
jgi:hypothetical protein